VVSKNSRIQLGGYTFTRVMRQLDGALLGSSGFCQRKASEDVFNYTVNLKRGCYNIKFT
jgi:hypothetical protein